MFIVIATWSTFVVYICTFFISSNPIWVNFISIKFLRGWMHFVGTSLYTAPHSALLLWLLDIPLHQSDGRWNASLWCFLQLFYYVCWKHIDQRPHYLEFHHFGLTILQEACYFWHSQVWEFENNICLRSPLCNTTEFYFFYFLSILIRGITLQELYLDPKDYSTQHLPIIGAKLLGTRYQLSHGILSLDVDRR